MKAHSIVAIEDELQNVEMAEREREKQNQELKIKKRDYTGYDDDEFGPGVAGMKRAVLSKYDDFLEGPKDTVSHRTPSPSPTLYSRLCVGFPLRKLNIELPREEGGKWGCAYQ